MLDNSEWKGRRNAVEFFEMFYIKFNLIIKDCRISDANIGLASKDRSELHIDGLKLKNCNTGITAYQKKPEFGPASIELYNYEMEDVKRDFMIEEGSELKR